jgi:hypothetical protein
MQTLMDATKLWGLINMTEVKLEEEDVIATITYTKKDNKAQNLLVQSLSNNQLMIVWKETLAHDIWEMFEKRYVDKNITNKIFLTKMFFMLQLNEPQQHHGVACQQAWNNGRGVGSHWNNDP